MNKGILPQQAIDTLINDGNVIAPAMGADEQPTQVQPASLDLRLGDKAYRYM